MPTIDSSPRETGSLPTQEDDESSSDSNVAKDISTQPRLNRYGFDRNLEMPDRPYRPKICR